MQAQREIGTIAGSVAQKLLLKPQRRQSGWWQRRRAKDIRLLCALG
jgi:hypothetical protein